MNQFKVLIPENIQHLNDTLKNVIYAQQNYKTILNTLIRRIEEDGESPKLFRYNQYASRNIGKYYIKTMGLIEMTLFLEKKEKEKSWLIVDIDLNVDTGF